MGMLILSTISILRGDAWNYAAARWRGRDSDRDSGSPKIDLRHATADDESVCGGEGECAVRDWAKTSAGQHPTVFLPPPRGVESVELTVVCIVDSRASPAVCSLCLVTLFHLFLFTLLPRRVALNVASRWFPSWPLCLSGRLSLRCASAPYLCPLWCAHLCFHDRISRACVD
jgi:hypothetical protein